VVIVVILVFSIKRFMRVLFLYVRKFLPFLFTVEKVPHLVDRREKCFRRCSRILLAGKVPVVAPTRKELEG
jgi:hypothetical protein